MGTGAELDPLNSFFQDDSNFGRSSMAADVINQVCAGVDWKLLESGALAEQPRSAWVHDHRLDIRNPSATTTLKASGAISVSDLLVWLEKQVS